MPLVTTFFISAFMAEEFDYPEDIYLIVCDADVSRQWVALDPMSSRINYCAPNARVAARLKLYGVPKRRIFLTGYPLPEGNISSGKEVFWEMDVAKADLGRRLVNLDPAGAYISKYGDLVKKTLGDSAQKRGPAVDDYVFRRRRGRAKRNRLGNRAPTGAADKGRKNKAYPFGGYEHKIEKIVSNRGPGI